MLRLLCLLIPMHPHSPKTLVMYARRELSVRSRATDLRKKRSDDKSRSKNTSVVNCADFQVISSGYFGTSPSLLVRSEGNSYLFNCNEGMQRTCYANKIKLLDLENVFITKHTWEKVSGVLGLALTVQDIGSVKLCVHSSSGINNFFEASSHFTQFFTGMECITSCYLNGDYKDSGIHIQPILNSDSYTPIGTSSTTSQRGARDVSINKKLKPTSSLIAYSCFLPDLPGPLDPQKCRDFNVPIGRELAILKSGQDVILADGTLVKSVDVCQAKSLGIHFIVVDCSSEKELDELSSNTILNEMKKSDASGKSRPINLAIHFGPKRITENSRYQEWIEGFDKSCKHLILSETKPTRVHFTDSYRLQYLMNRLDDKIFPPLYHSPALEAKIEEELSTKNQEDDIWKDNSDSENMYLKVELDDMSNVTHLSVFDKLNIRPHRFAELKVDNINVNQLYNEAKTNLEFENLLGNLKEVQKTLQTPQTYEPELVFLGTGSAVPSRFRNTSGILLNFFYPTNASVILDCGEDTYGQLCRHYGPEEKERILRQLKMIYVSHQHADHHVGLLNLLNERKKVTQDKVILLLPPGIEKLINYHNRNFQDLSDLYKIFCTTHLKKTPGTSSSTGSPDLKSELLRQLDGLLFDIKIVGVQHCINSCAVCLSFNIGHPEMKIFSVAYSGDARPSADFIVAASECDLLIHEATFDHRSQEDALSKKHSTTTEAIKIGKEMKAKFTILTHFTPKYSKIPYFTEDFDETVGFAFDHLSLRCPSQLHRLPIMKPILRVVFKKYFERADFAYHKQLEQQRIVRKLIQGSEK